VQSCTPKEQVFAGCEFSRYGMVAKRSFDIVAALFGILLLGPVFLLVAVWIKLDSKGPVFYRGIRAGRFGKPFRIWKLRTMVPNAESLGGAETPNDDRRITRAGDFLRRYKIDEFPQLLNVLAGEMSLVGPRPEVLEEVVRYTAAERQVLQVRPGITDWASIRFRHEGEILRGSPDPHRTYHEKIRPEKLRLQIHYVHQLSFWTDIQIIFRTLKSLFKKENAMSLEVSSLHAPTLVVDGGDPVRRISFAPWPHYSDEEIEVAASVLRSGKVNYWTGTEGRRFEQEFAAFCGSKHAVAVANGTVALELALYALGIAPGDEVIVPCRTFIASATCVVMQGGVPVFADVDPLSGNISASSIAQKITHRTKAIIAVHLGGWPCDMDAILEVAKENGIPVIEDCAQAHGATYKGRRVGSIGQLGAFSFCQDKIITTGGEGGMVITDDPTLWERMWSFKDHGRDYELSHLPSASNFRWIHNTVGTNFRLTEMQSALGRIQLRKLEQQLDLRRRNATLLTAGFSEIPGLQVVVPPPEIGHAYYKYYTFVQPDALREGWDRDRIARSIAAEGIPCSAGSCSELYLEKAFTNSQSAPERLPEARRLGETSLMFLVHPTLGAVDMEETCLAVAKVMSRAVQTSGSQSVAA
jgi:hypothetical protein